MKTAIFILPLTILLLVSCGAAAGTGAASPAISTTPSADYPEPDLYFEVRGFSHYHQAPFIGYANTKGC